MTKKDYVKLAKAINDVLNAYDERDFEKLAGAYAIMQTLADVLKADNSAFDRDRFMDACLKVGA